MQHAATRAALAVGRSNLCDVEREFHETDLCVLDASLALDSRFLLRLREFQEY